MRKNSVNMLQVITIQSDYYVDLLRLMNKACLEKNDSHQEGYRKYNTLEINIVGA